MAAAILHVGAAMTDTRTTSGTSAALARRAHELDAADPLRHLRERFADGGGDDADVLAYLDGNSLGRPPRATAAALERFVREAWGGRLIRGWYEGWMDWPEAIGDRLGRVALGAAPGQVLVADSTTVMLYKLARAAVAARPGRAEIVLDENDFPTDRYVLEGIAAERGLALRFVQTPLDGGVTADLVAAAVGPQTALVAFTHVNYRSAHVADAAAITRIAHDAGALVLWDLSHSAGAVEVALDDWGADLAVGCTYKYLNGGPGSPAFGYVRAEHQDALRQPVQGWLGRRDPFTMGPGYEPAAGLRRFMSGTPPVLAMVPLQCSLDVLEEAGIGAVRAKSVALTEYAIELADALLAPHGVTVASPRDSARRGSHVTLRHPAFRALLDDLWRDGVLADFREPDCLRVGLSPLTTTFAEVHRGLAVLADRVAAHGGRGSDRRQG
jgi:kynureninase